MTINVPGGRHIVIPLTLNVKRVQLLAYIAWRRGELIDRDKILEHVFGWGLSDEEATEDKLSERFESHKKLLRKKVREIVIEQINTPAGRQIIDPDLDPFISDFGFWGLSDICRVDDIEAVETNYKVISFARKEGKLVDEIPEYVEEACDLLIASYQGDFLASLIKKYPSEFRSWQGRSSWVRKPYTALPRLLPRCTLVCSGIRMVSGATVYRYWKCRDARGDPTQTAGTLWEGSSKISKLRDVCMQFQVRCQSDL